MTRFLQFCVVGATGVVVDFGSFHLLRWAGLVHDADLGLLGLVPYANMLAVALAIQWNFLGNRLTTFKDRTTDAFTAWWRFNLFSSSTWALNMLIVGQLKAHVYSGPVHWLGMTFDVVNCWKVVAIGICTMANFWLSTHLAFRNRADGVSAAR